MAPIGFVPVQKSVTLKGSWKIDECATCEWRGVMVVVDPARCAYCGGCVSVCPVEALTLFETRLEVSDECIDCGDCIPTCPVGALSSEAQAYSWAEPQRLVYDIIVVGAGPGGSMAAWKAAEAGCSVLMVEKRQEIGSPVRCAEGIGHEALIEFLEPDPTWIAAEINKACIRISAGEAEESLVAEGGRGYVLERRIFDRVLAQRAAAAGAEVRVKTAVTGLLLEKGNVCGVQIERADFLHGASKTEIEAKVLIAADGVEAQVGRWAGIDTQLPLKDTMVCVQYLLAGIDIDPNCTYYVIDYRLAPGGYAWIFPKGEREANVGLGVQADIWQGLADGEHREFFGARAIGSVLDHLNCFIEDDPQLSQGYPVTLVAGNVPVACSPPRFTGNGLMLVGDAARQVDPLTGGGIANAMSAGCMAAEVAVGAIEAGDVRDIFLQSYEHRWCESMGRKLQRNYRIREKFIPSRRFAPRFVRAFALAVSG